MENNKKKKSSTRKFSRKLLMNHLMCVRLEETRISDTKSRDENDANSQNHRDRNVQ